MTWRLELHSNITKRNVNQRAPNKCWMLLLNRWVGLLSVPFPMITDRLPTDQLSSPWEAGWQAPRSLLPIGPLVESVFFRRGILNRDGIFPWEVEERTGLLSGRFSFYTWSLLTYRKVWEEMTSLLEWLFSLTISSPGCRRSTGYHVVWRSSSKPDLSCSAWP